MCIRNIVDCVFVVITLWLIKLVQNHSSDKVVEVYFYDIQDMPKLFNKD